MNTDEMIKNYNMVVQHHGEYRELKNLQNTLEAFFRQYSWCEVFGEDVLMLVTDNKVKKDYEEGRHN